jgi:pimeloyl-ACP methyl ester carboxylesterase
MRARYPDGDGYVERDGVKVFFETFGDGNAPTVLLMPTWSIQHSRGWKMQVPYLARHYRVLTFDGRGNGRSDRPRDVAAYADTEFVADAVAVMDATGTPSAVVAGLSMGAGYALRLAAEHPDRVCGAVLMAPTVGLSDPMPDRPIRGFDEEPLADDGWATYNAHAWRRDWPGFVRFFFGQAFSERHSTKQIEDAVGWALDTDPETIILTERTSYLGAPALARRMPGRRPFTGDLAARVRCPCVVIQGTDDRIVHRSGAERLAAALGSELVLMEGSGHCAQARDPVQVNLRIRGFIDGLRLETGARGGWTSRPQAGPAG